MFNLEKAIGKWKKSLRKNPALEDGYIGELESHLRDEIDEAIENGKSVEEAFDNAVNKLGNIENIAGQYYKSSRKKLSSIPDWQASRFVPTLWLNYLKIGFRNIKKHKGYSAINIFGLAVGLTCVVLISMIIQYEMSYDDFHKRGDRIYRVYMDMKRGMNEEKYAPVMLPFAPAAEEDIPEIEHAVRISEKGILTSYEDKNFYERALYVDDSFFEIFTFPFIQGDPAIAVVEPNSVVITRTAAEKYFGREEPMGKSLKFNNSELYKITGIIEDLPANSHLRGEVFASLNTFNKTNFPRLERWGSFSNDYTYVLLKPNANSSVVQTKFAEVLNNHSEPTYAERYTMLMQPLKAIHFSDLKYDSARTIPIIFLYALGAIGIFILFIACINFINITTARSTHRNKEVGIRKVSGANRLQIIKQFLSESFIITIVSFIIALVIASVLVPEVNDILKQQLSLSILLNLNFALLMFLVLVLTALIAGAYPALVLSKQKPVVVLRNQFRKKKGGYSLRAALVVLQFAISVFLIIGTITVYSQLHFMLNKNLGFPSDKIVVVKVNDENLREHGMPFKRTLQSNENILDASFSTGTPGSNNSSTSNYNPEGGTESDEVQLQEIFADYEFAKTYGFKMISGRYFSPEFATDTAAYILNETAVKKLGWNNPVGKRITSGGMDNPNFMPVIGVIQDFNYTSLREEIRPTIIKLKNSGSRFLSLQLETKNVSGTLDFIKETYSGYSQNYPFDYFFLNDNFEKYYSTDKTMGKLLSVFSVLAIIISSIGVLGLVAFSTEQKSKEIGVRKVLGASITSIILMLCEEFVKWVLISNIIVWPLSYLVMTNWLNDFAYKTDFNYMIFVYTLLISIFVTIITVGFHATKAATNNPVDSLKYE